MEPIPYKGTDIWDARCCRFVLKKRQPCTILDGTGLFNAVQHRHDPMIQPPSQSSPFTINANSRRHIIACVFFNANHQWRSLILAY